MTFEQMLQKSEKRLKGLHPIVREKAVKLLQACYDRGVRVLIAQGYRSFEEQAELYAQGRTKPGKIVTNAKPGYSYHNYGLAIDFCLLTKDGRSTIWDINYTSTQYGKSDWMIVVEEAKKLGFEWGGDWKTFKDYPHLQYTFGLSINDLLNGKRPPKKEDADMEIHETTIIVKGKKIPGIIIDGKSYVAVRDFAELLGHRVVWNDKTKQVEVE